MNIHVFVKSTDICKSIVSGVKYKNKVLDSRSHKQYSQRLKMINPTAKSLDLNAESGIYPTMKNLNKIFPVLIISELNSPFSFV